MVQCQLCVDVNVWQGAKGDHGVHHQFSHTPWCFRNIKADVQAFLPHQAIKLQYLFLISGRTAERAFALCMLSEAQVSL